MTWRERIASGNFDHDLAQDWTTCAVGEQALLYPDLIAMKHTDLFTCQSCRDEHHQAPRDPKLRKLGRLFFVAVDLKNAEHAFEVLDAIEDRVLQMKRERLT